MTKKNTKNKKNKESANKPEVKKVEVTKQGVISPMASPFGSKKGPQRGKEEINPKQTHTPVQERSGTRGDR